MRIGVTGSSGFIGQALCDALTARGDEVVRFVRPATQTTSRLQIRWNPETGDVDDNDLARVGGLDGVINLAGTGIASHRWTKSYREQVMTSRTKSTSLLVEALGRLPSGVATLVSGSAIGFYGSRGEDVLHESSAPGSDYVAQVCQAWEACAAPLGATGAAVSFIRTGIVLGVGGGVLARLVPLVRAGLGGTLANGRQWMAPISLDDEVRVLLWALDQRLSGPLNAVAPAPCTNREFTKALGAVLHRPTLARVPGVALELALGRELARNTVLTSQRVVPDALRATGFTFAHEDVVSILRSVLST